MRQAKVGPTIEPGRGLSLTPPLHKSISSGCLEVVDGKIEGMEQVEGKIEGHVYMQTGGMEHNRSPSGELGGWETDCYIIIGHGVWYR